MQICAYQYSRGFLTNYFRFEFLSFSGMEDREGVICGYVHNVSPIGQGQSKKYFDFRLQTENDVIRAVCFSPSKRKAFDEASMKKSPVKIKRFLPDRNEDSTDILMNEKVVIQELPSIDFERKELVPEELNIAKLSSIMPEQIIDLKAKVINLQKSGKIRTNSDNPLCKREGLLLDPSGSIKIVLWESDTEKIEEGQTYMFKSLRLKKNRLTGDLYVNPAKDISAISTTEEFPPNSLTPPQSIPVELVTSIISGEIIGINNSSLNFCCFKCNKPVEASKRTIVYCENCNMKQKFQKCKKQWYVSAVVCSDSDKNVTLNFYNDIVIKILNEFSPENADTENEEVVDEIFFGLPTISYSYNERTRGVESIISPTCLS